MAKVRRQDLEVNLRGVEREMLFYEHVKQNGVLCIRIRTSTSAGASARNTSVPTAIADLRQYCLENEYEERTNKTGTFHRLCTQLAVLGCLRASQDTKQQGHYGGIMLRRRQHDPLTLYRSGERRYLSKCGFASVRNHRQCRDHLLLHISLRHSPAPIWRVEQSQKSFDDRI